MKILKNNIKILGVLLLLGSTIACGNLGPQLQDLNQQNLNSSSLLNFTSLHEAVEQENLEMVQHLLREQSEAEINVTKQSQTAFHLAVMKGNEWIVQAFLAEPKTKVDLRDSNGNTALHISALNDDVGVVTILLSSSRVSVNLENFQVQTPFEIAALKNNLEMVTAFLRAQSTKVNVCNEEGEAIFLQVVKKGYVRIVQAFLNDQRTLVNQVTPAGQTALDIAIQCNYPAIIAALLQDGRILVNEANLSTIKNNIADFPNQPEIVECLQKAQETQETQEAREAREAQEKAQMQTAVAKLQELSRAREVVQDLKTKLELDAQQIILSTAALTLAEVSVSPAQEQGIRSTPFTIEDLGVEGIQEQAARIRAEAEADRIALVEAQQVLASLSGALEGKQVQVVEEPRPDNFPVGRTFVFTGGLPSIKPGLHFTFGPSTKKQVAVVEEPTESAKQVAVVEELTEQATVVEEQKVYHFVFN